MSKKFKMPSKQDLKSRSSTISNAFAIAVTPFIRPSEADLEGYYEALGIEEGQCAYCLGDGNGKDHLKPLVEYGMPTGYITDIKTWFHVVKSAIVQKVQRVLMNGIVQVKTKIG